MPVFNADKYLRQSLTSIKEQTFIDFEILVINDGSTDSSSAILSTFSDQRLRIINNDQNMGLIYSLNRGLKEARGSYIARMDADDLSMPNRLQTQIDMLRHDPNIVLLGSNIKLIDDSGNVIGSSEYPEDHSQILNELQTRSAFAHPSVIFKKSTILSIDGYRDEFKHCEDYDLWLRVAKIGKTANIQEYLLNYRIHDDQITINNLKAQHIAHINARHSNLGLNDYSYHYKLTGKPGTLGSKYLSIAYQQSQLSNRSSSIQFCLNATLYSPLNQRAWKFLFTLLRSSRPIDRVRYYKKRLIRAIFCR